MKSKGRISTHKMSYVTDKEFIINEKEVIYCGLKTQAKNLPKQMLIGYMLEYLITEVDMELDEMASYNPFHCSTIDELYRVLKSRIKEEEVWVVLKN